MKTNEIIEKLQNCKTADDLLDLQKELAGVHGNVGYSFEDKVAFVDADIVFRIVKKMQDENISVAQLAKTIGYNRVSLQQALKNRARPIPMKYLNRIFGVLQL